MMDFMFALDHLLATGLHCLWRGVVVKKAYRYILALPPVQTPTLPPAHPSTGPEIPPNFCVNNNDTIGILQESFPPLPPRPTPVTMMVTSMVTTTKYKPTYVHKPTQTAYDVQPYLGPNDRQFSPQVAAFIIFCLLVFAIFFLCFSLVRCVSYCFGQRKWSTVLSDMCIYQQAQGFESKDARIRALEQERDDLKKDRAVLKQESFERNCRIGKLESDNALLKNEVERNKKQIGPLKREKNLRLLDLDEIESLRARVKRLTEDLYAMTRNSLETNADANAQIKSLTHEVTKLETQEQKLQDRVEKLKEENEQLKEKNEAVIQPTNLKQDKEQLEIRVAELTNDLTAQRKLVTAAHNSISRLKGDMDNLSYEKQELETEKSEVERAKGQLGAINSDLEAQINKLKHEKSVMEGEKNASEVEVSRLKREYSRLESENNKLAGNVTELENQKGQLERENKKLEDSNSGLENEKNELKDSSSALEAKTSNLTVQKGRLEDEISKLRDDNVRLEDHKHRSGCEKNLLKDKNSKLENKNSKLEAEKRKLEDETDTWQQYSSHLQQENSSLEAYREKHLEQLADLATKTQEQEAQICEGITNNRDLEAKLTSMEEATTELRRELNAKNETIDRLQEPVHRPNDVMANSQHDPKETRNATSDTDVRNIEVLDKDSPNTSSTQNANVECASAQGSSNQNVPRQGMQSNNVEASTPESQPAAAARPTAKTQHLPERLYARDEYGILLPRFARTIGEVPAGYEREGRSDLGRIKQWNRKQFNEYNHNRRNFEKHNKFTQPNSTQLVWRPKDEALPESRDHYLFFETYDHTQNMTTWYPYETYMIKWGIATSQNAMLGPGVPTGPATRPTKRGGGRNKGQFINGSFRPNAK